MTTGHKSRDGKLPDSINREAAKKSVLSSGEIDKYELSYRWRNIAFWSRKDDSQ